MVTRRRRVEIVERLHLEQPPEALVARVVVSHQLLRRSEGASGFPSAVASKRAAPGDAGADGARWDVEHLGDLRVVEVEQVAQHHRHPEVGGERGQRGIDVEPLAGCGVEVGTGRRMVDGGDVDRVGAAFLSAQLVEGGVGDDAVHPGGEGRAPVEAGRCRRAIAIIASCVASSASSRCAIDATAQRVHAVGVAVEQRLERAAVTAGCPGGEVGVVVTQTRYRVRARRTYRCGRRGERSTTSWSSRGSLDCRRARRGPRPPRRRSRAGTRAPPRPRSSRCRGAVRIAAPSPVSERAAVPVVVPVVVRALVPVTARLAEESTRTAARAARTALADANRRAGSRAMHLCTMSSSAAGTSGRCARIGGAEVVSRAIAVATSAVTAERRLPQSIS